MSYLIILILWTCLGLVFLITSLDDLLIDICQFFGNLKPKTISKDIWREWKNLPEKPIAVMIPAWKEASVLESMVRTNLNRIKYNNYRWYIGVYPNDKETLDIAKQLESEFPTKLSVVVTDRPGPTSKAHCLNCIVQVLDHEKQWIPHYVAIHDAEDIIHPYSFTAINAQCDTLDFIQLPIFSLPVAATAWVAGTYLDEFSEIHLKELPVRQKLKMPIPSAGVGTFFSWRILSLLDHRFGYCFNENNLTEDYEISQRIARLEGSQSFLLIKDELGQIVATREYFPDSFGRSVRQKTRWTMGIALQTTHEWGGFGYASGKKFWLRNLAAAYGLQRDRKSVWANPIVFIAWVLLFSLLFSRYKLPNTTTLNILVAANFSLFFLRVVQRARFTTAVYGLSHGFFSVPRILHSNLINGLASIRSLVNFYLAARKGQQGKIDWCKTDHKFPTLTIIDNLEKQAIGNNNTNNTRREKMKKVCSIAALCIGLGLLGRPALALDVKAFNLTESDGYPYDASEGSSPKTPAQEAVDYLYGLGVRHVLLTPGAVMTNGTASEVKPKTPPGRPRSLERDRYVRLMNYIHSKSGMTVGIRPIILVNHADNDTKTWHGNIKPEDPAAWFKSLRAYLDIYVNIAQLGGAEEVTVGAELYSMTVGIEDQWPNQPYGFPREWTIIIRDIKAKLGPKTRIMYDINYTDETENADGTGRSGGEMERWRYRLADLKPKPGAAPSDSSKAWEKLRDLWLELDMVGLDVYRSLMGRNEVVPNDITSLKTRLQNRAEEFASDLDSKLFDIERAVGVKKRVVIKETGFKSCKNCFIDPFTYDDPRREVSIPDQAIGYQAIFGAFVAPEWDWLAGVSFWDVAVDPRRAGANDPGFTPRGKALTEDVIRNGWGS